VLACIGLHEILRSLLFEYLVAASLLQEAETQALHVPPELLQDLLDVAASHFVPHICGVAVGGDVAQVIGDLDDVVVQLVLVLAFPLGQLFGQLVAEHRLLQHREQRREDLQQRQVRLAPGVREPDRVVDVQVLVQPVVQLDQLRQLLRDDEKLVADELLEQEYVVVLVDVVQPVDVRPDRTPQLPVGRLPQRLQQVLVCVYVRQLPDVDHVLVLHQHRQQLEHRGHVGHTRQHIEVEDTALLGNAQRDQRSVFYQMQLPMLLQHIDHEFLVPFMPLFVEHDEPSEGEQQVASFIVINGELGESLDNSVDDLLDEDLIVDEDLIIVADVVYEVRCPHPALQVRQDHGDVLHQVLLVLQVVEHQQRQVVVNRTQQPVVVFVAYHFGLVRCQLYVFKDRQVHLLHQRHRLEQPVVLLLLCVGRHQVVTVEERFVNCHQGLDVLQVGVLLENTGKEEQILDDT
jgi:hypothetical protein